MEKKLWGLINVPGNDLHYEVMLCRHASSLRKEWTQINTILCPVCKCPTQAPITEQTPDDWAAKLPTNAIVVSFLETAKSNKDVPIYCQPCLTVSKQHISVAYCVTCSEYLCNNCFSYHKIFKVSKDHTITVQSMPVQQNLNSIQEDMYRCSLHWKKYKYFCSDHKAFCCSDCAFKGHSKCDKLMTIKDVPKSTNDGQDFQHILDNLDGLKMQFSPYWKQWTEITKSIKDWSVMIKQFIERLESAALEELDQMFKQETVTISDEIIECKSTIAAIETSERMLIDSTKTEDETKFSSQ
ncbi:hypothetical protein CHS0354_005395 [Potamilus streckersoni]|uniref:B box-type domain-containing protein n=1 Tax=Potamilus streckersoni TaxID=2493646 RepID=A0AAE0SJA8_9BIVA|nr:hypothetical protein CHS0354_005395 [Potamilus streckersoni]